MTHRTFICHVKRFIVIFYLCLDIVESDNKTTPSGNCDSGNNEVNSVSIQMISENVSLEDKVDGSMGIPFT